MRARAFVIACTVGSAVVGSACSGAAPTELFGGASGVESVSGTEPEPGPASGGGSGSGSGGSEPGTGTGTGGTAEDAGTPPPPPPPPPPPWKSAGITCGAATCAPGATFCCAREDDVLDEMTFECRTNGCQRGAILRCDDQTDCATGQVCCAALDDDTGYRYATCAPACAQIANFTAVRFCDLANPVDECASIGKTCKPSQRLAGYAACL